MKLALRWTISLLIAALFVWLSTRQWPMASVWCDDVAWMNGHLVCYAGQPGDVSWTFSPLWMLVGFLVLSVVHFFRVLRWQPLLRPLAEFDFWTLNRVGAVSFMAVFIFPLRLGEFARPYLISKTGKMRKSAAFGTIAVERVMDGLMMALLLALVLSFLPAGEETTYLSLRAGAFVALLVFSGALFMLVLAWFSRRLAVLVVERVFGLFSATLARRLAEMLDAFIDGMKALPSWKTFVQFVGLSVAYWGVNGLFYYSMAAAFGLDSQVDLAGAYAMMAAVAVGMMIPNSPANVGSFWYFLLLPVALYGTVANPGTPLAFAVAVWALMLLQYTIFAAWFLVTGKVSLTSIWSLQKEGLSEQ